LVAVSEADVPAGLAVVADEPEEAGVAEADAPADADGDADPDADPDVGVDVDAAGLSPGLAATFSGFRSIVTGRFEAVPPEADCDAEPVVPDFGGSPEPAVPEEEDLPLAGSLSDAISTPPDPVQGVFHPTIHTCLPENTATRATFPHCGNQDSPGLG